MNLEDVGTLKTNSFSALGLWLESVLMVSLRIRRCNVCTIMLCAKLHAEQASPDVPFITAHFIFESGSVRYTKLVICGIHSVVFERSCIHELMLMQLSSETECAS